MKRRRMIIEQEIAQSRGEHESMGNIGNEKKKQVTARMERYTTKKKKKNEE